MILAQGAEKKGKAKDGLRRQQKAVKGPKAHCTAEESTTARWYRIHCMVWYNMVPHARWKHQSI
eukprot:6180660-Pleurochrysis_carterae.AAC.1